MNKKYPVRLLGMIIFSCLYYFTPNYIDFEEYSSLGKLVFLVLGIICFLGFLEEITDRK